MDDDIRHMGLGMSGELPSEGAVARWVPAVVVVSAVAGFVALAWYAYNAGTQSLNDEDILVVEADKTPVKEKPLDPGGMKFPNQDKTIFETFSTNGAQVPAKVERVLPPPEEPMPKQMDTSDTTTWVNKNLHDKEVAAAKQEQVIGGKKTEAKPVAAEKAPVPPVHDEKPVADNSGIESYTRDKTEPPATAKPAPAAPAKPFQPPAQKAPAKKEEAKIAAKPAAGAKAQLGAYRSEKEARASWANMQKKYKDLADKSPIIVKADLGEKGIYYRLRVGGFASPAEAKTFCSALSAKGQACLLSAD